MNELTEPENIIYEQEITHLEDELKLQRETNHYLNDYVDEVIRERIMEHYDIHAILRDLDTGRITKGLALDYIKLKVGYRQ